MGFFDDLVGFLVTKHAVRSYQRNLENEYYRNRAILAERERQIRAEEERAEAELRKCEEDWIRLVEEINEEHRQLVLKYEAELAEHEAKIEQLKQMEGDHSAEIDDEEFYAENAREMIRIYQTPLGEGGGTW